MSRLRPPFTATSVTAIPPSSRVWLPITAFCTTLDDKNMATTPNVFIAPSRRWPVSQNNTISSEYTTTVRMTFSANGIC